MAALPHGQAQALFLPLPHSLPPSAQLQSTSWQHFISKTLSASHLGQGLHRAACLPACHVPRMPRAFARANNNLILQHYWPYPVKSNLIDYRQPARKRRPERGQRERAEREREGAHALKSNDSHIGSTGNALSMLHSQLQLRLVPPLSLSLCGKAPSVGRQK